MIESVSILGLRHGARWTPGTGRRVVGAALVAAAIALHSAASWAWTQQGGTTLDAQERVTLLALVALAAGVLLVVFRPWAELTPAGTLVVQNPLRRHYIPLDTVAHAHRDSAGLHLRLTDGRSVIVLALHDAVAVADIARRDPQMARAFGLAAPRPAVADASRQAEALPRRAGATARDSADRAIA